MLQLTFRYKNQYIFFPFFLSLECGMLSKIKSLKRLCRLSDEELRNFYDSYDAIFKNEGLVQGLKEYNNGVPPSSFCSDTNTKHTSEFTADCYSVLKDLCNLGNLKKMYIPRTMDVNKTVFQNQALYEVYVSKKLGTRPGGHVLELGCGCGRIAHHMSSLTKCKVTGINIDTTQLEEANEYARRKGTQNDFLFCDFNDPLPFQDGTFDAIYEFAAFTTFIKDYKSVFDELHRVLKPGGVLFLVDAVLLDGFDAEDASHLKLLNNARMVMAGGVFLHYKYFETIAVGSGFEVVGSDGGETRLPSDVAMLKREHALFQRIESLVKMMTFCRILPGHMPLVLRRLRHGGDELVCMEEQELLTMTWEFLFRKKSYAL